MIRIRGCAPQGREQSEAVLVREPEVDDRGAAFGFDAPSGRGDATRVPSRAARGPRERLAKPLVVVDDEHTANGISGHWRAANLAVGNALHAARGRF